LHPLENPKPIAIIPARFASTRFPGKPLALLGGKPMVQHVWTRCQESGAFSQLIVATDDERIAAVVRAFGGEVALTSRHCQSGTDRIAEVARSFSGPRVFINVQGDEPLIHPAALSQLARAFSDPTVQMATLVRPLEEEERQNPNVVKAIVGVNGNALYFSRADIPYVRTRDTVSPPRYAHIGLYGYRRETLLKLAALNPSPLEQAESLEQLRALEHGISIRCLVTAFKSQAVDTPEDLRRAEEAIALLGFEHEALAFPYTSELRR
jgi:3-deoxy-manno-octulosonate cytidylyltransferase (CMP-KDO synthetase)